MSKSKATAGGAQQAGLRAKGQTFKPTRTLPLLDPRVLEAAKPLYPTITLVDPPPPPACATFTCTIPVRTRNPLNGQTGNSKLAGILRAKERRGQRKTTYALLVGKWVHGVSPINWVRRPPWLVTLTRIAPSNGLDDDGLAASMKSVRDGVADWLGLASDRDERVTWRYAQRRGKPRVYAVEIRIERREA